VSKVRADVEDPTMLFRLLSDHLLDLPDDDALVDELANVRLRERARLLSPRS
jgi:hypothetical protein